MAFRQPIVAPRRPDPLPEPQYEAPAVQVSAPQTALDGSREWVLFSPSQAYSSSQTRTTFTARTPRTAGRSRISDFGSIGTAARSGGNERDSARDANDAVGEEEDLDSLDDGLHAFHDPSMYCYTRLLDRSGTILPTHDGLGTFPASSLQVQEQLWQFEQHNPRKRMTGGQVTSTSLRRYLDATANADGAGADSERRQRIEQWRIDQSRLLLDEIEKQSRRIRLNQSGERSNLRASASEKMGNVVQDSAHQPLEEMVGGDNLQEPGVNETLWESITRRFCDLLGIDDILLSIILGDALPADDHPSSTVSPSSPELASSHLCGPTVSPFLPDWHGRLLDRLTRELGFLVQHLSEHPAAISVPPIPGPDLSTTSNPASSWMSQSQPDGFPPPHEPGSISSFSPQFKPTLQDQPTRASTAASEATNAALWGIEEEGNLSPFTSVAEERAYWERTPDVKSIFRLLHTRFTTPKHTPSSNPNVTTASNLASLRRASVIYQHHPLVSKGPSRRNRNTPLNHHHRPGFSLRRAGNSCASLSVRKSKRGSGSSRNYWDLGGSGGGGGSARAATVSMGFWGEV